MQINLKENISVRIEKQTNKNLKMQKKWIIIRTDYDRPKKKTFKKIKETLIKIKNSRLKHIRWLSYVYNL